MNITIRPLHLDSETDLIQFQAVERACDEHDYGASSDPTLAQIRARMESSEYWENSFYLAIDEPVEGGEMAVGFAVINLPLKENLDQVWAFWTVHPAYRGRGIGTALLEQVIRPALRESSRSVVATYGLVPADGDADDPSAPPNRLAARLGIERKTMSICRTLDLHPSAQLLEELEAKAAEKLEGYQVLVWEGDIPEEHLAGYGQLLRQLDLDDPDEDFENEPADYTPERLRHQEERLRARGMRTIIAVAQAPSGELVGNSVIEWHAGEGTTLAFQENTLVMPKHRGHRLGLALKVAAHQALARRAPHLRRIVTWNSHVNPWMIAINEQLGYEVACREIAYQGRPILDGPPLDTPAQATEDGAHEQRQHPAAL